jgi:Cu(I)/Ag(I) efflux system periplasmic protein CusF
MKKVVILAALAAASAAGPAQAQKSDVHRATGVVTKVDRDKVTIKHDPVPSLDWPTMTMAFKVKDAKVMEKLKPGAKVDFSFEKAGRDYVVTEAK